MLNRSNMPKRIIRFFVSNIFFVQLFFSFSFFLLILMKLTQYSSNIVERTLNYAAVRRIRSELLRRRWELISWNFKTHTYTYTHLYRCVLITTFMRQSSNAAFPLTAHLASWVTIAALWHPIFIITSANWKLSNHQKKKKKKNKKMCAVFCFILYKISYC